MESKRIPRTQAERSAATRSALLAAARPLFAEHGYAAVSTDQIARAAGVTRGALYHQFAGKEELFAAVFEEVEGEIADRLAAEVAGVDPGDPQALLTAGIDGWLAACADPAVRRIALLDAPSALGWERWREIGARHGIGLVEAALGSLVDAGAITPGPVTPLAHLIVAASEEAALYAARAEDPERGASEIRERLLALVGGLLR